MAKNEAKIVCETPTPGKKGTRILQWKYDVMRVAIRKVVPRSKDGIEFRDLANMVEQQITDDSRRRLGSILWYTVTVKLHLEVIGEIERIPGSKPQRIRRVR
jgi:hypothetical protein